MGVANWILFRVGRPLSGERREFIHVGGRCANPTHQVIVQPVRAVIVEDDFFGVRGNCQMSGRLRGTTIRGIELCAGSVDQYPIIIELNPDPRR